MTKIRGRVKELWLDFLYDIAGGFLQAVALHCFIDSIDIAPGGATGLAILLNRFTSLPIGILTFAVNVPLLIAAWIYLGKGRTIKTLKTVAVLTVILDFIITPYVPVYTGDKMVSCIFGGVLMGPVWPWCSCAAPPPEAVTSQPSCFRSTGPICRRGRQ